jgi:ribose transport system substrate-binding protein
MAAAGGHDQPVGRALVRASHLAGGSMFRGWFAIVACVAMATGCSPQGGAADNGARDKLVIAVVPKATSHEFWKSVHAGAIKGAQKAGVDIIWKGPITESNREEQINVVQDFIAQGVDGICLAPLDSQALTGVVREAHAAGIPTLIYDSGLDKTEGVISFVATDNYHGGELAGRRLGELLGGKGRAIVLRYAVGSQSSERREQGCLDVLAKEFPGIEILSSNEYAGETADKALVKSSSRNNCCSRSAIASTACSRPRSTCRPACCEPWKSRGWPAR